MSATQTSGTKYSIETPERELIATGHVKDQWEARTPWDQTDLWSALDRSVHYPGIEKHDAFYCERQGHPDAVHLLGTTTSDGERYPVAFIERSNSGDRKVTTVLRADWVNSQQTREFLLQQIDADGWFDPDGEETGGDDGEY